VKRTLWLRRAPLALALAFTSIGAATAADMPVKAPPMAVAAAYDGGYYVWVDGSYQSVHLPGSDLGIKRTTPANFADPVANFNPSATGQGISGAVGYVLPTGTLPAMFGANARIEIGGSFVSATSSRTGAATGLPGFDLVTLTGVLSQGAACGPAGCTVTSALATDYKNWQVSAKEAGDFRYGALTITPWAMIFGGVAHTNQNLTQQSFFPGVGPLFSYNESSSLKWVDVGPKLGVDTTATILPWMAIGLAGNIGLAERFVSLSAVDGSAVVPAFAAFTPFPAATAIGPSTSTTAFVANAEADLTIRPLRNVELRGFAGLNYDNRVPGVSAPVIVGIAGFVGTQGTPAGLKFASETSYYAGGGITVKFGP
jgi:hypothetical protein